MLAPIEETIQKVERLYQSVTGHEAPRSNGEPYAPIPPEADATRHVEESLARLLELVQTSFAPARGPSWRPPLTLREERGERVLELDLPGVSRDSLSVVLSGDVVTVSGHRQPPDALEAADGRVHSSERLFGPFERSVQLPGGVAAGDVRAKLTEGVLEVRVPKSNHPEWEPRNVPVT